MSPLRFGRRQVRLTRFTVEWLGPPREWGWPGSCCIGKVWHSEECATITCVTGHTADRQRVRVQTRGLIVVQTPQEEWVPAVWRRAAAVYCRQWPDSAYGVAWFAALTDAERRDWCAVEMDRWQTDLAKGPGYEDVKELAEVHGGRLAVISGGYRWEE